jgi:L-proline amide hydrolase
VSEDVLRWDEGWTWYRVVGDPGSDGLAPLVLLHGGPGAPHDYLEPLSALTDQTGRACVFYDQLGCGRSQHLPDAPKEFWGPELFCRELDALLEHLEISGRYHLLGQSWGGMLAMEHAVRQPPGLRALVIANSPASMRLWIEEANRLRRLLPEDVQRTLARHEDAGTTDSEEYQQAMMRFYERHLCRIVPFPDEFQRTFDLLEEDPTVYHTMNGPSEFHVIGTLRDWDITPRLREIRLPVLVISGEHDEATPVVVRPLVDGLPDARWELIDDASHSTHLEQPERFRELVAAFLASHD